MRRMGSLIVAVAIVVLASPPARAGSYPNLRQGWLVGLGMGGGSAEVTDASGGSGRETGFAGSFRVGYAFNPTISLELGSNAWVKDENGTTVTFSFAGPTLNFYPGATGLVLRGGVGAGTVDLSTSFGGGTFSASESGLGLSVGAGYEFRVTRRFALGPQVDFTWTDQDSYNTNHINGTLAACWYFVPKSTAAGK
jgi:outer membrane protein with beta-barrel domain